MTRGSGLDLRVGASQTRCRIAEGLTRGRVHEVQNIIGQLHHVRISVVNGLTVHIGHLRLPIPVSVA